MLTYRSRWKILIFVTLVAASTLALAGCSKSGGAKSPEAVVDAYIAAISAKDEKAILTLVKPGREAEKDAQRIIHDFGGSLVIQDKTIDPPVNPDFRSVSLSGTSKKGPYRERLLLAYKDKRWWLVLGRPAK